ncbi:MAG: tetratricopeptide repeat protein, partial [Thermogutta sp.]|nr:tetratricopeptide repeat protein [Thermogutta sp.]
WRLRQLLAQQLSGKHEAVISALTPLVNQWTRAEDLAAAFILLGRSQLELGKVQEASESFLQASAKVPNAPPADEALLLLASAYRRLGRTADARTVLEKMLAQFPNSPLANRARFRLGEYCFALGDFEAAEKAYRAVIQSPDAGTLIPGAMYELACTLVKQDRAPDAEKLLAELLAKNPDAETAAKARYVRAVALRKLGNPAEAVRELQAALQGSLGPLDHADALYTLGLVQIDLKQYAEAAGTFAKLAAEHPDYPDADRVLYQWAWALKLDGRDDEAVEMFRKLVAQFPKSEHAAEARYHSGEAFYKSGDYFKAAEEFHKAVQAAGQSELGEKASHRLGWAYYQMKQYENAQKTFAYQRAAYPRGPLAADAQFMEAESFFQLGKYAEALAGYEKLPQLSSDGFRILHRLHAGQAAAQLKQWNQASDFLTQCLKDYPDAPESAEVLYELGNVYRNRGDNAKALDYFSQAAARSQGVTGAKAQFMIGELHFLEKKYDEAVKSFFRVAYGFDSPDLAAVQADATFEAALCLELLNRPQQAAQLYREVLEKFPQSDKVKLAQAKLEGLTRQ